LDASNVISRPAVTSIVTIDYDHQQVLGETLREIAAEKAGIIKAGSPMVTGLLPAEAASVVRRKAVGSQLIQFGIDYGVRRAGNRFEYWNKSSLLGSNISFEFSSPLPGIHQGHNMAVAASIALQIGLKPDDCVKGIEGAFWPGRLEHCTVGGRSFVLDSAHNSAGIQAFIGFLKSSGAEKIDLTFGVLDTKNWQDMVALLTPYVGTWRLLKPESDRALPSESIIAALGISRNEVRVLEYGADYERCLRELLSEDCGTAYITGSIYMLGKLRKMLSIPQRPLWRRLDNSVCAR
jgi:dihydrofolate synthase/folylpolyglutamate synthase